MAVYKQSNSKNWWYKFNWNGRQVRESTKQTNKRIAEQMEAAHRASLAKGDVGIREKGPAPTIQEFVEQEFRPFVESRFVEKPKLWSIIATASRTSWNSRHSRRAVSTRFLRTGSAALSGSGVVSD
jgi:hypothetical protein